MAVTAKQIKHSFTSIWAKREKQYGISAEDLLRLVKDNGKASVLKQKVVCKLTLGNNWKKRFVVLAGTALYIYSDKTSCRPKECISLKGYNCVHRVNPDKISNWAFAVSSEEEGVPKEIFDCSSDKERSEWMQKIKESLYTANKLEIRKASLVEQLASQFAQSGSIDEVQYTLLEKPVYQVQIQNRSSTAQETCLRDSVFSSDNYSDEDSDDGGDYSRENVDTDDDDSYEVGIWCRLKRKGAIKRRRKGVSSVTAVEVEEPGTDLD